MARLVNRPTSREANDNKTQTHFNSSTRQAASRILDSSSMSSPPSASCLSDKENYASPPRRTIGKPKKMSQLPTPSSGEASYSTSNKRRKLGERGAFESSQAAHHTEIAAKLFYDPEQPMDERRAVRKNYRDLSRELAGMNCSRSHCPSRY